MEVSRYLYNMNITLQIPSPRLWVYWTIREARLLDWTRESGTEMLTWYFLVLFGTFWYFFVLFQG